jgi:hypothetical protein
MNIDKKGWRGEEDDKKLANRSVWVGNLEGTVRRKERF